MRFRIPRKDERPGATKPGRYAAWVRRHRDTAASRSSRIAVEAMVKGGKQAVVLERIARGGGRTEWYYVADVDALAVAVGELRPGSMVSFYFDGRIGHRAFGAEVKRQILDWVARDGDAVFGRLRSDGIHIDMELVGTDEELEAYGACAGPDEAIFFGAYPGRDNDGVNAITFQVPDGDGLVRPQPH